MIIFYSWQSDIRAAACRTLIEGALQAAADAIAADGVVEPVIDRDTASVPGAPDIGATILAKIDAAAVFVADVTFVGATVTGKSTPNPNVLVELGYALKALGWSRVLLVQNTALGPPEDLPFDLRQKRAIVFSSPVDASDRANERRALQAKLELALREIVKIARPLQPAPAIELAVVRDDKKITPDRHDYDLKTTVTNTGKKRIDDWEIEIELPTQLCDGNVYAIKVDDRSDANSTLFRVDGRKLRKPLRPGDSYPIKIGYFINKVIYDKRDYFYALPVKVRVLVDGEIAATVEKHVADFQNF